MKLKSFYKNTSLIITRCKYRAKIRPLFFGLILLFFILKGENMKKKHLLIFILSLMLFTINASAKETYYVNDYGVSLTKEEYDFFSYMFWENSQNLITENDYEKFVNSNIISGELDSNVYYEIENRGTSFKDLDKSLKITKSCASDCFISTTLTWNRNPAVRSYDVIGAYLENTNLVNNPVTTIVSSGGNVTSDEIKKSNNGFGVSILLPKYGNSLVVNQTFKVKKGGTIYASYQHAMKSLTLTESKNYTLSKAGYGGVFKFSGTAANVYDKMSGVDINL